MSAVVLKRGDGLWRVHGPADRGCGDGGLGVVATGMQRDLCGADLEAARDDAVLGLESADEDAESLAGGLEEGGQGSEGAKAVGRQVGFGGGQV